MATQQKRIGSTTYVYDRDRSLCFEVKGPYRPGSVWKLEVYPTNDLFPQAWEDEALTPVQRDKISPEADRVIAAICMGQSNAIDPELTSGVSTCIGYLYKTKKAAMTKIETYQPERKR